MSDSAGDAFVSAFNSVGNSRRMQEEAKAAAEDRAFQRSQRMRLVEQQGREDQTRADLAAAAAPAAVQTIDA